MLSLCSRAASMPNRTIHERARTSRTLAMVSHGAERLFWRLTTVADDHGRFDVDPNVVRATCFPLLLTRISVHDVEIWLDQLRIAGALGCYSVAERHIGYFLNWGVYQRTRALKSKYPAKPQDAGVCCHPQTSAAKCPRSTKSEVRSTKSEERPEPDTAADVRERGADVTVPRRALSRNLDTVAEIGDPTPSAGKSPLRFRIPQDVLTALDRARSLAADPTLRSPDWWQAEIIANPSLDYPDEIRRAHAWRVNNPGKGSKRPHQFLHNWLRGSTERRPAHP